MKNQAFFSSKDKSKKIKLLSAAILFGALRVNNQLLQLCTARTVFTILVTVVQLFTVMPEVCHWLTNEKQRKSDNHLTDK